MNALEIRDLCKSYPGFSLQNLNLTLPQGCIMGLIGENGAGKSTTIKLILEMVRRDSGSIRIFGKDNTCLLYTSVFAFRRQVISYQSSYRMSLTSRHIAHLITTFQFR